MLRIVASLCVCELLEQLTIGGTDSQIDCEIDFWKCVTENVETKEIVHCLYRLSGVTSTRHREEGSTLSVQVSVWAKGKVLSYHTRGNRHKQSLVKRIEDSRAQAGICWLLGVRSY